MDAINNIVLVELQEYAQLYFAAIVEANTEGGTCTLTPGKYTAKDMTDNSHKNVFGHAYALPSDSIFDEQITIKAGTFECEFPYRNIFSILASWESMYKAGKQKAVFEIGAEEVKSAKVLIDEQTMLGAYKTKTMKLQRIGGNWWAAPKEIRKEGEIVGYYELNGLMFAPGKSFWGNPREGANKKFIDRYDDAEITKLLVSFITECPDGEKTPYYAEVARLAKVETEPEAKQAATATETAKISTQAEKAKNEPQGEKKAVETPEMPKILNCERKVIEDFETIPNIAKLANAGIIIVGQAWHTEYLDQAHNVLGRVDNLGWHEDGKGYGGFQGSGGFGKTAIFESWKDVVIATIDALADYLQTTTTQPPQPPQISETAKHTAAPPKLAVEPPKQPRRVVRHCRTAGVRTCKNFLIVASVPRCRTAHRFRKVVKIVAVPPARTPPIRGDCKLRCSARAKPPDFTIRQYKQF